MSFQVHFKEQDYSYNIGQSNPAKKALEELGDYKKNPNYNNARIIIENLYRIVNEDPSSKLNACEATNLFSQMIFLLNLPK